MAEPEREVPDSAAGSPTLPGWPGRPVLAIDIGGTKIAAALVGSDGLPRVTRRTATPRGAAADAETLWTALTGVMAEVLATAGAAPGGAGAGVELAGVGVGCGGPMRWPTGEVSPVNIPGWRAFPLRARLAAELPGLPVRLHNDGVCAAVAEHWRGAARGHRNALGMVVSTGVGGGLVLGDRLVDGATGNAGHVGHLVVDPDGPPCACGSRGCLEAVSSGTALASWAGQHGWRSGAAVVPSARAVAAAARAGDGTARMAFRRAGELLGRGIASAVTLTDVSVVTVGGGVSQAGELLFAPVREAYARLARMPYAQAAEVLPAALGAEAGLVGAAALVLAGSRYWSAD